MPEKDAIRASDIQPEAAAIEFPHEAGRDPACRERKITPHVANVEHHKPAIDGRTTRHPGNKISQCIRKRVEEIFGWTKTVGLFRKTRFKGIARTDFASRLVGVAYNLRRMANLLPQPA